MAVKIIQIFTAKFFQTTTTSFNLVIHLRLSHGDRSVVTGNYCLVPCFPHKHTNTHTHTHTHT